MRRIWALTLWLAASVIVCRPAWADVDEINLGGAAQKITFIGGSSGFNIMLGACSAGVCTLSGSGTGTGTLASNPAPWSITTSASNSITLTKGDAGLWTMHSTQPLKFSYGLNGSLLTGDLTLVSIQQTGKTLVATFTITPTGGSLASQFGAGGGVIHWSVTLDGSTDLAALLASGLSATGALSNGELTNGEIVPTPEPSTLLLIGSGLVCLGGVLRSRAKLKGSKAA